MEESFQCWLFDTPYMVCFSIGYSMIDIELEVLIYVCALPFIPDLTIWSSVSSHTSPVLSEFI